MISITDEEFKQMVEEAVVAIPERFASHLDNVAFLVADEPSRQQLRVGGILHGHMTLLGLYEGIPLPSRNAGYSGVLPDAITVFKSPHEMISSDIESLRRAVHETVWHEVAHYFGLDHGQIRSLEK